MWKEGDKVIVCQSACYLGVTSHAVGERATVKTQYGANLIIIEMDYEKGEDLTWSVRSSDLRPCIGLNEQLLLFGDL